MSGTWITDQDYLLREQYKDATSFSACLQAIKPLLTSPTDWHHWIFRQIRKDPGCRVLELGCGPGDLWQKNVELIPADWDITLSDFSAGMLKGTQENLRDVGHAFTFQIIDAQAIPFAEASFDRVIADCMLYHVPDLPRAIAEISRVVKSDGYVYAATFSKDWFSQWGSFLKERKISVPVWQDISGSALKFCLENGHEQLAPHFSHISLHHLKNMLVVKEAGPLLGIMHASMPKAEYDEVQFQQLRELLQRELAQNGPMQINFDMGLFEASKH